MYVVSNLCYNHLAIVCSSTVCMHGYRIVKLLHWLPITWCAVAASCIYALCSLYMGVYNHTNYL